MNSSRVSPEPASDPRAAAELVLDALPRRPGGPQLLAVAVEASAEAALVGGAVRDILLGREPRELDVVIAGPGVTAPAFATELATRLGGAAAEVASSSVQVHMHERFGTAVVQWEAGRVDVAERRAESYAAAGALPEVRPGTVTEDLARRDFTVNAIAVPLAGSRRGTLDAAPRALEDLAARRLRVLHDASFTDDPTRLLRLARYAARLGFQIEPHTEELAERALAAGALDTVSGARIGAELRLALAETDVVGVLTRMQALGLLAALHPRLRLDKEALERAQALLPSEDGRPDLLALAALTLPLVLRVGADGQAGELAGLLDRLELTAADRDRVLMANVAVPRLVGELASASRPSQLAATVAGVPVEGIALAGALDEKAAVKAKEWLTQSRHVRLEISGADLIAAGVPEGPEIGRRLRLALLARLDGELAPGRDPELAAALEARV